MVVLHGRTFSSLPFPCVPSHRPTTPEKPPASALDAVSHYPSQRGLGSDETGSIGNDSATVAVEGGEEAASEAKDANGENPDAEALAQPSEAAVDGPDASLGTPVPPEEGVDDGVAGAQSNDVGDAKNGSGETDDADAGRADKGGGQAGGEGGEEGRGASSERVDVSEHAPPLVVTDIVLVTFREGENVRAVL